jgi:membrane dipeptidase
MTRNTESDRQWPHLEGFCNRASLMTSPGRVPIFDGHNDVLFRLFRRGGTDAPRAFLKGEGKGQLDFPMARQGGFAGGLFAIFVPSAHGAIGPNGEAPSKNISSATALPPALELMPAQRAVFAMVSLLLRIERESQGRVRVCRNVDDIQQAMEDGLLAPVMHIEGAEAIDPNFEVLDVLYEAGLRSLGPVWSQSNAFGHGVPFLCPSSPDTGPGLTDLGKELIATCNRLSILIDLSHLNERGFWDVAAISNAPLVATHSNAHALSPHSRNLTDKQLTAIGETGGMVGVNFATSYLRPDGHGPRASSRTAGHRSINSTVRSDP